MKKVSVLLAVATCMLAGQMDYTPGGFNNVTADASNAGRALASVGVSG